ncbi:hypothetical protein GXW78_07845 [Roseomonas terrae]|jgi:hypothetical protein|uniref:Sel1 repeat family protein n=1 Tax=Neoroseomonas terrae TaxID=424799 RepID=A0ABS5EEX2_9PROT|nr:hypothetical protein [Neoroseomonas terrae]MBR0649568.1 hypothetical protein [Neoroseomonas terrae]
MTLDEFRGSVTQPAPPTPLPKPLEALWWDAKGDWNRAHEAAQAGEDADSAWVHAYLHRKEGDLSNAAYWYRRAGRAPPATSLPDEWTSIARDVLA